MRAIRWSRHALQNLVDREIDRAAAERVLTEPGFIAHTGTRRAVRMSRYFDRVLRREMLLRVVVEEPAEETVVVTVYKTSQIQKYLRGLEG